MRLLKVILFSLATTFVGMERVCSQIPSKGPDFPAFAGLHWGMTIQAARDSLKGKSELQNTASSILSMKDKILNIELDLYLNFTEKDSLLGLNSIVAYSDTDSELLRSIEKYFVDRYGNKFEKAFVHKGIDGEKKTWRLNGEMVVLQTLVHRDKIVSIEITYYAPKTKRSKPIVQIPMKGSEFATLTGVRWGMTMDGLIKSMSKKCRIKETTFSEFSYEDTLLNAKAKITLKFDESDSLLILYAVEAEFLDPANELLQSLRAVMISHYGDHYVARRESKSKFFFVMNMEMKTWRFANESIGLMTTSYGETIKRINLLYKYVES